MLLITRNATGVGPEGSRTCIRRNVYTGEMSSPKKRRVQGGRVTPKGTQPHNAKQSVETVAPVDTTPSPPWVTWLLFGLLAVGMLIIFFNYVGIFGDTSNGLTLLGLVFILGGIMTATKLN